MDKEGVDAKKAFHDLYGELEGYRQRRGYSKGWTAHKFKQITGRWPNGEAIEQPAPASHGLLQWIKRQNAAYAKGLRLAGVGSGVSMRGADNVDATSSLMDEDDWGVKL